MANANYLPVLLVSVTTNVVPDDSSLSTRPRAQVDYLSHEWQEEDVWRSWRKMTRQKNEITNGIRLENASWRTWWKQRNKLKTVTPETLNWLKDSDVTWLYGPLHTADDDKPLPKPPGIADNASNQPTPSGDCSRTTKPILKYRSISELLTSDLPNSPLFSPAESDEEHDSRYDPQLDAISTETFAPGASLPSPESIPKRPKLLHTKSDTHITRWGPSRAFRKDSPPRIEPPGHHTEDYFPKVSAGGPVRTSLSQDSNSSAGTSTNGEKAAKKKHISFNTFVEQVIAIDKPKRSNSFYTISERSWDSRGVDDDDDGYEEDQEDSAEEETCIEAPWSHPRIRSTGVHGYNSPDDIEEEEEEDGIIEMRTSFRHATPKKGPRSQSKASNASSSSSVSTASSTTYSTATSSSSPSRDSASQSSVSTAKRKPLTRRTSSSTYRPHLVRPPPEHVHVTIAPIAPTVLKTTDMWEEGFGDEGAGSDDGFGWRERLWGYNDKPAKSKIKRRGDDDGSDASGTPVELVYVPPFNSRFSYEHSRYGETEEDDEDDDSLGGLHGFGDDEELEEEDYASGIVHSRPSYRREDSDGAASDIYLHRGMAAGSVGFEDYPDSSDKHLVGSPVPGLPIPIPVGNDIGRMEYIGPSTVNAEASIPKLVVMEQGKFNPIVEEDEADFFDGDPDYGNEYMGPVHRPGRPGYGSSSRFMIGSDERPSRSNSRTASSRSRSKSHSRTPSPAMDPILPTSDSEPLRRSYSSASPSPNYSTHLLPPTRGRSHQDLLQSSSRTQPPAQSQSRGRSSARTSGSSSIESSTSPFGGMSPDSASSRTGSASAYVGGGRLDRERDRDRTGGERRGREPVRERERGRDRTTDKRLSVSQSNSPEPPRGPRIERESSSATTTSTMASAEMDSSFVSSASSTSSSKTVIPPEPASPPMSEEDYQREAEEFLRRTGPTPSNSPVIQMRAPPVIPPVASEQGTPTPSSIAAAAASSSATNIATPTSKLATASSASPTSAKAKPPPLAPSPPHPAKPSTSYTAVSSPTNKGNPSPSRLMTTPTTPSSDVLGIRERSPAGRAGRSKSPQSDTIMGKAAEIAGAFFGLWNHSSSTPSP